MDINKYLSITKLHSIEIMKPKYKNPAVQRIKKK